MKQDEFVQTMEQLSEDFVEETGKDGFVVVDSMDVGGKSRDGYLYIYDVKRRYHFAKVHTENEMDFMIDGGFILRRESWTPQLVDQMVDIIMEFALTHPDERKDIISKSYRAVIGEPVLYLYKVLSGDYQNPTVDFEWAPLAEDTLTKTKLITNIDVEKLNESEKRFIESDFCTEEELTTTIKYKVIKDVNRGRGSTDYRVLVDYGSSVSFTKELNPNAKYLLDVDELQRAKDYLASVGNTENDYEVLVVDVS